MVKQKVNSEEKGALDIAKRLDGVIALLLILAEEKLDDNGKVKLLISLGFDNDEIANIVGMAYGSVANIRMKNKGGKKWQRKKIVKRT